MKNFILTLMLITGVSCASLKNEPQTGQKHIKQHSLLYHTTQFNASHPDLPTTAITHQLEAQLFKTKSLNEKRAKLRRKSLRHTISQRMALKRKYTSCKQTLQSLINVTYKRLSALENEYPLTKRERMAVQDYQKTIQRFVKIPRTKMTLF